MFHSFWSITILTPGCSVSVVVNTFLHSSFLSILYDSVTFMVPMISSVSSDRRATSVPGAIFSSCDIVIGMGQKMPFGHLHRFAHALPIVVSHEAFERRETADTQHDEVAGFARRQL